MSAAAPSPFAMLGVQPDAGARDVERAAQRLLAQLEVGARSAASFELNGQWVDRTAEDVRGALTVLRDPEQRLAAELRAMATEVELPPPASRDLWAALGWRVG
ncbi:MAG: hypothetical protein EXR69_08310 [Myxococcales bacterium]|nr:hypothetical protein [Myxococcales bacterium]